VFATIIKEDIAMEHTSTRCKINNTRDKPKIPQFDIIHNRRRP
jgi:hypothetical protein